jgi:vancomycin resistance protein YoaR
VPWRLATWVLVPIAVAALLVLTAFAAEQLLWRGRVPRGVWVENVALAGLDREQAARELQPLVHRVLDQRLIVLLEQDLFEAEPVLLGLGVDVERTVEAALGVDQNESPPQRLIGWLGRWVAPTRVGLVVKLDRQVLEQALIEWEARAGLELPEMGGIRVNDEGRLSKVMPRAGRLVDRERAVREAVRLIADGEPRVLRLVTAQAAPRTKPSDVDAALEAARALVRGGVMLGSTEMRQPISFSEVELEGLLASRWRDGHGFELYFEAQRLEAKLELLRPEVEVPPLDARFVVESTERVRVEASRAGTRLSAPQVAEALWQAAHVPERRAVLPVSVEVLPNLTTDQAVALNIRRLVSHFTTRFECCQARVTNIRRIAELVNGTVVRPGEVLSINTLIGSRTTAKGFVPAPGIEEGEMVDSIGGGISQFATTLFNAVFHGGYDVIERQPHSYWFSRYPMGVEATLSFPKPDLSFRNDSSAGLLILATTTSTSVTVSLYGDNEERRVSSHVSPRHDIVEPPVELIANPSVSVDKERVREPGSVGWSVIVSRTVTFRDASEKREQRRVIYYPRARRIELHPCRLPVGHRDHTGERCPLPSDDGDAGIHAGDVDPEST